jgi:hypothetical protein
MSGSGKNDRMDDLEKEIFKIVLFHVQNKNCFNRKGQA